MSALLPDTPALLGHAAELRARGTPWDGVATQLMIRTDELRRLVRDHARTYDRLADQARREFAHETLHAALARLHGLLQRQNERVALSAASTLVRYDLAQLRHRQQARTRKDRQAEKPRNELPPLPGETGTAEKNVGVAVQKTRCDTPSPRPQVPVGEGVSAGAVDVQKAGCDSVTAAPAPASSPPTAKPALSPDK